MKRFIILISLTFCLTNSFAQHKILFDNTKNETAGNADWVIDNDQPIPSPAQSGITPTTPENYWLGGISSWGVEMVKQGFLVETLPSSGRITYGDGTNAQDLSNYKIFVVCEPNNPFSASEKTAMMNFVNSGGGLFIVSDHAIADRDGDGWDALEVWNDFMTVNPVKTNPFGILFDAGSNISAVPSLNVSSLVTDPILHGTKGDVEGIDFHNGATMTINTTDNSTVKAAVYQTGYSNTGTTGVMVAYATYGSGRVVAVGDSSVPEDETAQSGTTYPGWTEPLSGVAMGDNGVLMTNGTIWLAASGSVVIDPQPTNNATNFAAIDPTSSSIKLTWTDASGGTLPAGYLVKWHTSLAAISNPVDGTPEANSASVKNISQGAQTTTITGLTQGTTYYFKIFPFTNSGTNINYLISSTPSTNATTLIGATTINSENFENCASITWRSVDVSGDDFWTCGTGFIAMNGFGGTVDEDWLISPSLNLNNYSGEVLTFKTATQYTGPALELVYSTNYDGTSNPSLQGTWNSLSFTLATTTSFTSSGSIGLAGISGASVYVAFKYKATGIASGEAALWQVDDILIEGSTDATPPTVTTYSPIDNTTTVAPADNLILTFNENVKQGTAGNIVIYNSNATVFETITYNDSRITISGSTVTVNPSGIFVNSSAYYVNVDATVIRDMAGNTYAGLSGNTAWNFSIQPVTDVTPPTVTTYSPIDNTTTVAPADNLILTFNENVKQGTAGNIIIYNSNATTFETIPYNDSRITISGSTVTVNPSGVFVNSSAYYVSIDATVIRDMAGNAYSGLSGNNAWNFTIQPIADVTPPTVISISPADNATTVAPADNLILTFNENVKQGTAGNIVIYNSNATVFETIPYNDSRITISGSTVTVNPSGVLVNSSAYYVSIDATVIRDMAGNAYAGLSGNTAWNFVIQSTSAITEILDAEIFIYPNPTNGLFKISSSENQKLSDISIFDVTGRMIKQINSVELIDTPVDLSGYAKGVFIIKLQMNGKFYKKKLVLY